MDERPPSEARRRPRLRTIALCVYLALLALSHVVRWVRPAEPAVAPAEAVISLREVDGAIVGDRPVRMAYRDEVPDGVSEPPTVLLLHGSPGRNEDFDGIVPLLASRYRVIAPDLPGFGSSSARVPDYSNRAHARYVLQLIDRLGLNRVHVVGFSMGGGVALQLYAQQPERVRSLTLLSAIGVQEFELFGSHRLNHLVHGAQLGVIWLAREGLPHMGLLDRSIVGVAYARNFFDTDQRPLRAVLQRFAPPMLILHGRTDFLVPVEAALEHHRLVPQSELQLLDRSHFMVFTDGEQLARRVDEFLARVEDGSAPERARASEARSTEALAPFDPSRLAKFTGFALLLMMALIALATLVSEDLTCIAVGLLVAQGRIGYLPGVVACLCGIFIGDMLLYLAGRVIGRPALAHRPLRWIVRPERLRYSSEWFARRGPIAIVISRFLPGTRIPTFVAAGLLRTSAWSFSLYFLLAVSLWTPLLVGASMIFGERAFAWFEAFERHALLAVILVALSLLALIKLVVPLFTYRGRRLLWGRLQRAIRWEFWPPWLFYPPVVAWIILLGLRFRSPALFTAANPAIEAGGFVAESKGDILDGLAAAGPRIARFQRLDRATDAASRLATAREFIERHRLDYPVVLKPDAGQRGSGVVVVRDEQRLRSYVEDAGFDLLIQEYAPGAEFGIFYYRLPGESRGRIFSITEKRIPVLVGDGERTVERLILDDPRAVCMADLYLRKQAHQLFRVPAQGERIPLVELGTHSRGAIFLDGNHIQTEALERAIDELSRTFDGFYFGRYDLCAPDVELLKRGEGFRVIELNGVTSEATHIYDPAIGLIEAYRTLFREWRLAFEIGARNRERGVKPVGPLDLLRRVREYRRTSQNHPE